MIPDYTPMGLLPEGIHPATWTEIEQKFGTNIPRRMLLNGLNNGIYNLKNAGCKEIFIDGSFVTEKEFPNDYDCCWEVTGVDPNKLDPILLNFEDKRMMQKLKYRGEFFPSNMRAIAGKTYLEFFQIDKLTGSPKGIISLKLGGIIL